MTPDDLENRVQSILLRAERSSSESGAMVYALEAIAISLVELNRTLTPKPIPGTYPLNTDPQQLTLEC